MLKSPLIRLVAAALAGAVAALVFLGLVYVVNEGRGFTNTAAATSLGWTVPIVAGGVVALVALALLHEGPIRSARSRASSSSACVQCGGTVRGEWRLCPHCGALLGAGDDPEVRC